MMRSHLECLPNCRGMEQCLLQSGESLRAWGTLLSSNNSFCQIAEVESDIMVPLHLGGIQIMDLVMAVCAIECIVWLGMQSIVMSLWCGVTSCDRKGSQFNGHPVWEGHV